jgi:hypothetical protein
MSKRNQTTGLPKSAGKRPEPPAPSAESPEKQQRKPDQTQEYKSRAEREAQFQRYVIIGTGAAVAFVAVVLVLALILDQVIRPNQVVASVEGDNITVRDFQQRVRFERVLRIQQLTDAINTYQSFGLDPNQLISQPPASTWFNDLRVPDQLGRTVLNDMINEQIIRQEAAARGITVSAEQIQQRVNAYFGYDPAALVPADQTPTPTSEPTATPTPFVSPTPSPTPTQTPQPTQTPEGTPFETATPTITPFPTVPPQPTLNATERAEQFDTTRKEFYDVMRRDARLNEAQVTAYFEMLALRNALRDAIAEDITRVGPFVNARHILVATEAEANDVLTALQNGESFAELAKTVSTDTSSGANGGELGWSPVYNYVKPFADAVLSAEIGAIVGPVQSQFGYHIIQVRAREDRELTDEQWENARNNIFQTWLEEQRKAKDESGAATIFDIWTQFVPNDPPSPFG